MKISTVAAVNFRGYHKLNFDLPTGLTLIDGPNMAGKTTMLDSIFWALYGWLPKWKGPKGGNADAVIKRGTKSCYVSVSFYHNGKHVLVERQRPAKLIVTVDGKDVPGKIEDLNRRIEELSGMTPSQFLVAVYITQKRQNSFFTMSDADRTALLSVIAGLEELDAGLARAKTNKEVAMAAIQNLDGQLMALEEQINALPIQKAREEQQRLERAAEAKEHAEFVLVVTGNITTKIKDLQEKAQAEADQVYALTESEIAPMREKRTQLMAKIEEITIQLASMPKLDTRFMDAINSARQALNRAVDHNQLQKDFEAKNQSKREAIAKAIKDAESVQEGKCGSCKQPLPHWDRGEAIKPYIEHAQKLELSMVDIQPLIDTTPLQAAVDEALSVYHAEKAKVDQAPGKLQAEANLYRSDLRALESSIELKAAKAINLKNEILQKAKNESIELAKEIKSAEYNACQSKMLLEESERAIKKIDDQLAQMNDAKAAKETLREDKRADLNEALDLFDIFGPKGFRAICFDGLVQRIGDRAGQLLSIMTNGVYTTRLDQVGEDAKGVQKLILKPVVLKGGQEVFTDDLSGGAEDRIALAYDIAVSDCVAEGAPLLLDEAMSAMDVNGKSEAMVLLEEVSRTRPVLVVDHSSEFKASFQQVINVKHERDNSYLEETQSASAQAEGTA